jgi:hypothetical protein
MLKIRGMSIAETLYVQFFSVSCIPLFATEIQHMTKINRPTAYRKFSLPQESAHSIAFLSASPTSM